ncbi:MAG: hypothetical protein IPG45_12510 [Deltaproteobacteria bacterium]|nr:hypothetical protein [Deltaproteobacteria bacterium]
MKSATVMVWVILGGAWASEADALPRFSARTGAECRLCHVSPSGGGVRTRYGSQIFQRLALPIGGGEATDQDWAFSGQVMDGLTLGGDLRGAYLYSTTTTPEGQAPSPGSSTFFLMQADLYAAAHLSRHFSIVLDLGVYSGFEAYLLFSLAPDAGGYDLHLRVGHFQPSFGLRDVNHDLYTRGAVGFGPTDRDTGLELTGLFGPLTVALSLVNGTFNDAVVDRNGAQDRKFEKALALRTNLHLGPRWLPIQVGASIYYNPNVDSPNPLFTGLVDPNSAAQGVDELRLSAHALVGFGRFTYQAEWVFVQDQFAVGAPGRLRGYTSAQELGARIIDGLDLLGTFEFQEPDVSLIDDGALRFGVALEIFPLPYLDLRLMVRRALYAQPQRGDGTDVLCFAHGAF